jgi:cell division transport system ATP-binding protein
MLQLEQIAMSYDQGPEVLHDINLTLESGDFIFLMGPSGAGKTSLMHIMGLIHMPSRGSFRIFGRDVVGFTRNDLSESRRRIGMMFQDFRLINHLTAFDNVALPLRIGGAREREIRELVYEMLEWLGLTDVMDAKPPSLSTGQRQIVAAARAAISRPNLLLGDEPTSNIDTKRARRLMRLFTELSKEGTTVVLSTHNDELIDRYPHPVYHLEKGRLTGQTKTPTHLAAAD